MENRIKVIRAEKQISQAELASMAGISRVTLSQIEKGKIIPSCATLLKLVQALQTPCEEIFLDFNVR